MAMAAVAAAAVAAEEEAAALRVARHVPRIFSTDDELSEVDDASEASESGEASEAGEEQQDARHQQAPGAKRPKASAALAARVLRSAGSAKVVATAEEAREKLWDEHSQDVILFSLGVLKDLKLEKSVLWVSAGAISARCSKEGDGSWTAETYRNPDDTKWLDEWQALDVIEDGADGLYVRFSTTHPRFVARQWPEVVENFLPPHYAAWSTRTCNDFPMVEAMTRLFHLVRDADKGIDVPALQNKFLALAWRSGFEQTRKFLKKVEQQLAQGVGDTVDIDEDCVDKDGEHLYLTPDGDPMKLSPRALALFQFATGPAKMAVLAGQVNGPSHFLTSSVFRANEDEGTAPSKSTAKRLSTAAAPGPELGPKKARVC